MKQVQLNFPLLLLLMIILLTTTTPTLYLVRGQSATQSTKHMFFNSRYTIAKSNSTGRAVFVFNTASMNEMVELLSMTVTISCRSSANCIVKILSQEQYEHLVSKAAQFKTLEVQEALTQSERGKNLNIPLFQAEEGKTFRQAYRSVYIVLYQFNDYNTELNFDISIQFKGLRVEYSTSARSHGPSGSQILSLLSLVSAPIGIGVAVVAMIVMCLVKSKMNKKKKEKPKPEIAIAGQDTDTSSWSSQVTIIDHSGVGSDWRSPSKHNSSSPRGRDATRVFHSETFDVIDVIHHED